MASLNRRGASLLELVIALTLTFVILAGAGLTMGRIQTGIARQVTQLEYLDALRVATDRIGRSVHAGGTGIGRPLSDGLTHRAFRGSAVWCGDGWLETGIRLPDPERDSVWWVVDSGEIRVADLVVREPGGCSGQGYQWRAENALGTPGFPVEGGVVRWFESARLRVDDAVRYGRLNQPAQPLTPAVLGSGSHLLSFPDGSVELRMRLGKWEMLQRWPGQGGGTSP